MSPVRKLATINQKTIIKTEILPRQSRFENNNLASEEKKLFPALRASIWSKYKERGSAPPGPSPGSVTGLSETEKTKRNVLTE